MFRVPVRRAASCLEPTPDVIPLRKETEVAEKGIVGKAGRFVPGTNQLFFNMLYPAFGDAYEAIRSRHASAADPEALAELARSSSEKTVTNKIGIPLVLAQAKRRHEGWTRTDLAAATSPEALSIAADNWEDLLSEVGRVVGRLLGAGNARRPRRHEDESTFEDLVA